MRVYVLSILALSLANVAIANPDITSREYKLMLNPNNFTSSTEASNVNSYFQAAIPVIEQRISRDVSGSMSLDKTRQVRFYDAPNSCLLNQRGYIFRERVENGNSEVTLKYRGYDRYIADFEDVSGSSSQAETKLEADISSKTNQPFAVLYSHSTTEPNTRTLNDFQDVNTHFPAFASNYGISNNQALAIVGNFTAYERVYSGGVIDLGQFDAEMNVTLWYNGTPSASSHPVVAEVSFKYADSSADYSKSVVNRAANSFAALKELSTWNSPSSLTKTQYAYQYNPQFCQ